MQFPVMAFRNETARATAEDRQDNSCISLKPFTSLECDVAVCLRHVLLSRCAVTDSRVLHIRNQAPAGSLPELSFCCLLQEPVQLSGSSYLTSDGIWDPQQATAVTQEYTQVAIAVKLRFST